MFRFVKTASAALALTGVILAQPAFAARSADSLPVAGVKLGASAARLGSMKGKHDDLAQSMLVPIIVAGVVVGFTIVIIADDNNDAKSPG